MKCVGRKTTLHYSKKCPSNIDERFCLEGVELMSCSVSLTAHKREMGISEWFQLPARVFLEMFTQI